MPKTLAVRSVDALFGAKLATLPIDCPIDPALLLDPERPIFDEIAYEHRRREWWCGRIAAHAALSASGGGDIAVVADARGAPRLEGADVERFRIAISHGKRLAAAIAGTAGALYPCVGVDVVDREDRARISKLEARVLSDHERALFAADPEAGVLAWGAREAVAKATATGMFAFALKRVSLVAIGAPSAQGFSAIDVGMAGVTVLFERLADGGVLVVAGCTDEVRAKARAEAGLA